MKLGILGNGSIGKRHAENAARHGIKCMIYDPYSENASESESETRNRILDTCSHVIIASPTTCHYEDLADCAISNSIERILVEKPIAGGEPWDDVRSALYRAARKGIKVFTGCNMRFTPEVQRAKAQFASASPENVCGHAMFRVCQWSEKVPYLHDGVTLNWLSHEVDLALYILGPAVVASAHINHDDTISDIVLMHTDNHFQTLVHGDYITYPDVRDFMIAWDRKRISTAFQECSIPIPPWVDDMYRKEMDAFLFGIDEHIMATGLDGLKCYKILMDAREIAGA